MRLIDADKLKDYMQEIVKAQKGRDIDLVPVSELPILIDKQPTAYDVDKVVVQLEEYRNGFMENVYEELKDDSDNIRANNIIDGFDEVFEIVKKAAAEHNNGWIPCTDRLPTPEEYQRGNGRFLVTDGNRTYEAEFDIYESHTFGKSRMATDWFVTDKCVTHWQNEPLPPEPYQQKGEL